MSVGGTGLLCVILGRLLRVAFELVFRQNAGFAVLYMTFLKGSS